MPINVMLDYYRCGLRVWRRLGMMGGLIAKFSRHGGGCLY